jgi:hypothetical protein
MFKAGVLTALAVFVLAGCGQEAADKEAADIPAIETEIAELIGPEKPKVDCPNDIEWKEGKTFDCGLEAPDGSTATVEVTLGVEASEQEDAGSGETEQGPFKVELKNVD